MKFKYEDRIIITSDHYNGFYKDIKGTIVGLGNGYLSYEFDEVAYPYRVQLDGSIEIREFFINEIELYKIPYNRKD